MTQSTASSTTGKSITASIGGYIAAFIALGSWSAANLQHMRDLNDKEVAFQQYKSAEEGKLRERELQLNRQKIEIEAQSKELAKSEAEVVQTQQHLESQAIAVRGREEQIQKAAHAVSSAAQRAKEEAELNALMNKVAELGADLKGAMPCDPDGKRRYLQAKMLVKQIETRAASAGLDFQYDQFISANTRTIFSTGEKCK